jgi:hypothetical protein
VRGASKRCAECATHQVWLNWAGERSVSRETNAGRRGSGGPNEVELVELCEGIGQRLAARPQPDLLR